MGKVEIKLRIFIRMTCIRNYHGRYRNFCARKLDNMQRDVEGKCNFSSIRCTKLKFLSWMENLLMYTCVFRAKRNWLVFLNIDKVWGELFPWILYDFNFPNCSCAIKVLFLPSAVGTRIHLWKRRFPKVMAVWYSKFFYTINSKINQTLLKICDFIELFNTYCFITIVV